MIVINITILLITLVHFTGAVQKKRLLESTIEKTALLPDWKGKRQRSIRNGQGDVITPTISSKRQRKNVNYQESSFSSLTPSSSLDNISSLGKTRPDAKLKASQDGKTTKTWKPTGYFTHKEMAKRTAKRYLSEGKYKDKKEALKSAWVDIRERKRIDALNRRQRMKSKGTKSKDYRKPHHHSKERVISRKVIRLLAGDNNVVQYQVARKLAEEEYAKETREYSALYRKRKKAIKKQE